MSKIKIRYLLLPLLVAIIVYIAYLLTYVGAFRPVTISQKKAGPFLMIYKDHTGPYHKIVPVIEEVEKWAQSHGLDCKLSFGEYLDNPEITEEARLRSHGGCLVALFPENLPEDFHTQTIPEKNYVTAIFEGSAGIGPLKVYPKVFSYFEENRLARQESVLEIYEVHGAQSMTTTYYFPIK